MRANLAGISESTGLTILFVNGDFQRAQKTVILGSEFDLPRCLKPVFGLLRDLSLLLLLFFVSVFVAAVKSNRCLKNQEYVVAGPLDFADRLRDPVRLGKGIVDRVSQFLHE